MKKANDLLKSIVTAEQARTDTDLIKFVKEKIQTQSELIAAIVEKLEEKQGVTR